MTRFSLLTADVFKVDEAACVLQFPDPMATLMAAQTRYLPETHDAVVDLVTAIEVGELPCVELPDDEFRRSGDQTGPYVYAATTGKGLYTDEAHARRSRYAVERVALVAFAEAHEYPAPTLLSAENARYAKDAWERRSDGGKISAERKRKLNKERNRNIRESDLSTAVLAERHGLSESQIRRIKKPPPQ